MGIFIVDATGNDGQGTHSILVSVEGNGAFISFDTKS